jgi:hypothetical protein
VIELIDIWLGVRPPRDGANDEQLALLAEHCAGPMVVIGGAGAAERAKAFGLEAAAHVGVRPGAAWLGHRRLWSVFRDLGRPVCRCWSPFARRFASCSGGIVREPAASEHTGRAISRASTRAAEELLVPVADHPSRIDTVRLVEAGALLAAGGHRVTVAIPSDAANVARARRLASIADRAVRVRPVRGPVWSLLAPGTVAVDHGHDPSGALARLIRASGAAVADARGARSGLSLAMSVRAALTARPEFDAAHTPAYAGQGAERR